MPWENQHLFLNALRDEIDLEAEEHYPIFRFNDFKPKAQKKFIAWLKKDSSIYTLRAKAKKSDMLDVVRDLNPILIRAGFNGTFSYSTIYRWVERRLSSLIFNSMFRRNPRGLTRWYYKYLLTTPSSALKYSSRFFSCIACGNLRSITDLDEDLENTCVHCADNQREHENGKTHTASQDSVATTYANPCTKEL